ncbi:MAG: PemK family transcriptional regulator [Firmicutes bacterium HGW-Firmicutes-7]|nr:MAG: PemK family transcriptional regulator [Firmicutes bacterium HGW-Firmicutes-7]
MGQSIQEGDHREKMNVGEVWFVEFPYEDDLTQFKPRPCIVLDIEKLEVLSIKVTSQDARDDYDVPIFKWRESHLDKPSFARVSKTILLKKESFLKKLGDIHRDDFNNIVRKFMEYNSEN